MVADSLVLRNRQLIVAENRKAVKKPPFIIISQIIHPDKRQYSRSTASAGWDKRLACAHKKNQLRK